MSRADFYDFRLGEFFEAMRAYRQEAESGREHVGNLVRTQTFRIFRLFASKKDQARLKKEEQFWPMPWDERSGQAEKDEIRRLESLDEEAAKREADKFLSRLNGSK